MHHWFSWSELTTSDQIHLKLPCPFIRQLITFCGSQPNHRGQHWVADATNLLFATSSHFNTNFTNRLLCPPTAVLDLNLKLDTMEDHQPVPILSVSKEEGLAAAIIMLKMYKSYGVVPKDIVSQVFPSSNRSLMCLRSR